MRVYVGPEAPTELTNAVRSTGAELSSLEHASALVWFGAGPERFAAYDHPGLEWVQLPFAGVEDWVASGVLRQGITFTSAAGAFAENVAEHALALALAGARQLHTSTRAMSWTAPTGMRSLLGATVGIIGAGGIGRALIELLEPFRTRILAVNHSGRAVAGAERVVRADEHAEVEQVLAESDFVVLAAPATARTRHLIDAAALRRMRSDAWLINIARGSLVDTDALVAALDAREIAGAALDVTDPEPLPDEHRLFRHRRALVTPHCANPEELLYPALARRVADNVRRRIGGEPLLGVVDRTAGY